MTTHTAIANNGTASRDVPKVDTLTRRLGELKVEDTKANEDTGVESDSDSDGSESTGDTSPDRNEPSRSRSPISKGDVVEMNWQTAQLMLRHRLFFWDYRNSTNQFPNICCWTMYHAPAAESQFWNVSLTSPRAPYFYFQGRLPHFQFANGEGILMDHRLVLSSSSTPMSLYTHPENFRITLYENHMDALQEWVQANSVAHSLLEQHALSPPTELPEINPNLGRNQTRTAQFEFGNDQASMQTHPGVSPEYMATGLARAEEAASSSGQDLRMPATSGSYMLAEASNPTIKEVGMRMDLKNTTLTWDGVYAFATQFRKKGPGSGADVIICLHCPDGEDRRKITDLRPWNLTRHLVTDLGIKSFTCTESNCSFTFTLKDQRDKHVTRHHQSAISN